MNKEIGGYLSFENLNGKEFYDKLLRFNSSRNCLRFLIQTKKIKKIYLPIFLCDVVYNACLKEQIEIEFYHINEDFSPNLNNVNGYVYIVNYYGLISNEELLKYKNIYNNVIVDNTHAFFQPPVEGIDTIYNCRKYFGVPDGAYLSTDIKISSTLEIQTVKDMVGHLLGRMEENASSYYNEFSNNDKKFDLMEIKQMSSFTHNIMKVIDYDDVLFKRKSNYNLLDKKLKEIQKLKIKNTSTFMYPLMVEDNLLDLRKYMIENKIYVPCLWNNIPQGIELNNVEKCFQKILPLPIDQRYDEKDMEYISDLIFKYVQKH
ncbi:MAG: hypothetical protein E7165_00675 [Firmicutes bacterium]|nr:hypothetical protein [Bacillota bacterium]